jgi:hypothetical protein
MELKRSMTGELLMYLDADTNRYVYLLEHDGKVCPYYFHDTKISHQYAAYNVIKKDLDIAREAFMELNVNHGQSPTIRLSLLFAGIILYGKCYSEARGRRISLNHKTVFNDTNDQLAEIHERVISLRNQYVAHAGEGDYEQYPVTINLYPDANNKAIHGFMINGIHQVHHEPFLNDEISKLDIEEIYNAARTPTIEHSAPISGIVKFTKKYN